MRLCYRIEKEAGCGEDEYGNPTAIYSCIKMDCKSYNVSKEEYSTLVKYGKKLNASQLKVDESLITPITLNEYLDNTEEDCFECEKCNVVYPLSEMGWESEWFN